MLRPLDEHGLIEDELSNCWHPFGLGRTVKAY